MFKFFIILFLLKYQCFLFAQYNFNDSTLLSYYSSKNIQTISVSISTEKQKQVQHPDKIYTLDSLGNLINLIDYKNDSNYTVTKNLYNKYNSIIQTTYYNNNRKDYTVTYTYNNIQLLVKKTAVKSNGNLKFSEEYVWNKEAVLVAQKFTNQKGMITEKLFKYNIDEYGNITQKTIMDKNNKLITVEFYEYDTSRNKIALGILAEKKGKIIISNWEYNDQNQLIKLSNYSNEGVLQTTHTYHYKDSLITTEMIKDHQENTVYLIEKKYNNQNQLTSDFGKYELDNYLDYKYTITYNNKGKEKFITVYDENDKIKNRIRFTYDKKGNKICEKYYKGKRNWIKTINFTLTYY